LISSPGGYKCYVSARMTRRDIVVVGPVDCEDGDMGEVGRVEVIVVRTEG
jgi:hypothetical protein